MMDRQLVMYLDRRRTFRMTPEAMARERELVGVDTSGIRKVAAALWPFLIHEDPGLTVGDVERILRDFVGKDWGGFRKRRILRLRTRLGAMLYEFIRATR